MSIQVLINGRPFQLDPLRIPVDTSLNTFIRQEANLSGTKSMCFEGGCGACIVAVQGCHPVTKENRIWAVNSCLMPVYACEGLNVITVEGIGDKANGYHVAQSRLAQLNETQCGYCSPGMVMNMYSLMESKGGQVTMADVENSFGGNVCRCTGYRPIMDAFKSLAVDADEKYKLCDIEDFPGTKKCPKTGSDCSGSCKDKLKNGFPKSLHLTVGDREWHKVYDVSEISQILGNSSGKKYMLVSGNTAHGVFRRDKDVKIFIDVNSVDQLRSHALGKELEIGGGVKLTEFMEILKNAAETNAQYYSYCRELYEHVDLIANVPVRNAGSIAGNLMIKHAHPHFPSDIFVILAAVKATLTIAETGGKMITVSMKDFLKLSMDNKIIFKVNLPQLDDDKFKLKTYKIMKRAQNTHAYVNAGFLFEFSQDKTTVQSANLCIGGINEHFINAAETEKILIGRKLFCNKTMKLAFATMEEELDDIPWILPEADPKYRRGLAIGLLYKAILKLAPDNELTEAFKSGCDILTRPISSGIQEFDTYQEDWPVTKAIPKFEGFIQTAGEARYANDLPKIPEELWGVFVQATAVGSRIKSIDASRALNQPGVHGFFSAKDIPGSNNFAPLKYKVFNQEEEQIFCSGEVLYYGQPLGVILADSVLLASKAAKMVDVEYEKTNSKILPTIWDVFDAKADDRIFKQPQCNVALTKGPDTTRTIKGRYECGGQYHYTMEPQNVVVIPSEYGLEVHSSTQYMDMVQVAISDALLIPENEIIVVVKRLGGGYGGKITRASFVACAAALAAHKLQRPVRMVLSMETNMEIIGKRFPCIGDYEVEVDNEGRIQKLNNEFWQDFGCSLNESVIFLTAQWFLNCYKTDYWSWNSWAVRTNSASNTYCRAPGILEGLSMIENIMEHIAFETNQCPIQVRLNNMAEDQPLRQMIDDFLVDCDHYARKKSIDTFNQNNRWKKKGISVVPLDYPQQFFGNFPAMVSIYSDGTVLISHGGIEMGQGLNTKVAQVAARTLNVPLEFIRFRPCDTMTAANSMCSGGSSTSDAIAVAVMHACEMILEKMKPVREVMPDAEWKVLTNACSDRDIELTAHYIQKNKEQTNYAVHGVACAEVEIDVLTGNVQLTRVDIYEDVGASMSPLMDVGQIEGAFVMGIGFFFNENLVFDKDTGKLLTNRSWNYTPPGPKDIPVDFRIKFVKNSVNPVFIFKSKATGEPPLAMTCVCLFALRNAILSARKDVGVEDWLELPAPATPDQIYLKCLSNSKENYKI